MNPIIYLDYDGVCASHQRWSIIDANDTGDRDTSEILIYQACPWAMRNLKMLVENTKASIVISSSRRRKTALQDWRYFLNHFEVLHNSKVISEVIGMTNPDLDKANAIVDWHREHDKDISAGLVIDDSSSLEKALMQKGMGPSLMFCKTDPRNGFSFSDMNYAAMKLNPLYKSPLILM